MPTEFSKNDIVHIDKSKTYAKNHLRYTSKKGRANIEIIFNNTINEIKHIKIVSDVLRHPEEEDLS